MKIASMFAVSVSVVTGSVAFAGNVCTWTGEAGDGKWNTPGNWKGELVPVSYNKDTVIVSSAGIEPGGDGVAMMCNDIPGTVYVDQLQIADDSGPLRITGNRLGLSLYKGIAAAGYVLTIDKAGIACLASGSSVEIATDIASTGERAIYLGEGADLTLSGRLVDGNASPSQKVYFYKYGPTSSRFALMGEVTYSGYTYGSYTNVAFYAYGGTNVIGGASCPANTEVRFGGGSSAIVFTGGETSYGSRIVVQDTGAGSPFDLICKGETVVNGPIEIRSAIYSLKLRYEADCTYNGSFGSSAAITYVSFYGEGDSDITFAQGLDIASVDTVILHLNGGSLAFDGPLRTVRSISDDAELSTATLRFNAPGNDVGSIYARYFNVVCGADNAFGANTQWTWGYASNNDRGVYDLQGHSQTIDRFSTTASDTKKGRLATSAQPATLTLRSSATCTPKARLGGALSLVYAPTGAFVHELSDIDYTSTGDLTVSNGTFKLSGTSCYKDVSSIFVADNATFEDASTSAESLANVRRISVADGGTFRVTATSNPFAGKGPVFDIGSRAILDLSTAVLSGDLSIMVDGEYVVGGRYQPQDGTDGSATRVGWLASGSGVAVVNQAVARWRSAVDGRWDEDDKWTTAPNASTPVVLDQKGCYAVGVLESAGVQTNLTIANETGLTTLAVSNLLTFADGSVVSLRKGSQMTVGEGGAVEIPCLELNEGSVFAATDADVSLAFAGTAAQSPIRQNGGTLRFAGDSSVRIGGNWCTFFGSGLTYLGGTTECRIDHMTAPLYMRFKTASTVAGMTNHVVIADHAVFGGLDDSEENLAMTVFGNFNRGNLTRVDYDTDALSKFGMLVVGATYGYTEMNVRSGTVLSGSNGITVGGFTFDQSVSDADVVGIMRVQGGNVVARASGYGATKNRVYTFVVGGGWYDVKSAMTHNLYTGRIELEGGTVSNLFGSVILGAGCADGSVIQTGGEFVNVAQADAKSRPRPMIVGWLGGTGAYVLSNGVAKVTDPAVDVYVGGVPTGATAYVLDADRPSSDDPAFGLLDLEGGEMTVAGNVVLSADGYGTLSVGPAGKLSAASLVCSNGTFRTTLSVARFRCGESGCGSVVVKDLVVCAGAKLEVDLGAYDCARSLRLVRASSMTGRFDDSDVTIRGSAEQIKRMRLVQGATGVRLATNNGCMLIVY